MEATYNLQLRGFALNGMSSLVMTGQSFTQLLKRDVGGMGSHMIFAHIIDNELAASEFCFSYTIISVCPQTCCNIARHMMNGSL